jgi:hypothetical protein
MRNAITGKRFDITDVGFVINSYCFAGLFSNSNSLFKTTKSIQMLVACHGYSYLFKMTGPL